MNKLLLCTLIPTIAVAQPYGIKIIPTKLTDATINYENDLSYPNALRNVEERNKHALLSQVNQSSPTDTHLKKNRNLIPVDHRIPELPINPNDIIGYAAIGTWKNNNWTGLRTFFKLKDAICDYSNNIIYGLTIENTNITYDVNGKPTSVYSYGDVEYGYLYSVNWFTQNKDKTVIDQSIECAVTAKGDTELGLLIQLAKEVDKA